MFAVESLTNVGLGLEYHALRLDRTTDDWVRAGSRLRDRVVAVLGGEAAGVEQIGSSSVVDLLAKPIIDLAVGVSDPHDITGVTAGLEAAGWIYRGNAGDQGGHVFVLEARPWFRVAHAHIVEHGGSQWLDYLRLRDLLRESAAARACYSAAKTRLAEELGDDRKAYTEGKTEVVRSLLGENETS
jgi:GrpB-like predicted nucleotidyltransferase (UPF0157 family)